MASRLNKAPSENRRWREAEKKRKHITLIMNISINICFRLNHIRHILGSISLMCSLCCIISNRNEIFFFKHTNFLYRYKKFRFFVWLFFTSLMSFILFFSLLSFSLSYLRGLGTIRISALFTCYIDLMSVSSLHLQKQSLRRRRRQQHFWTNEYQNKNNNNYYE